MSSAHEIVPKWRTRGFRGRFIRLYKPNSRRCAACGCNQTKQWRRGHDGRTLCNPCGIRARRQTTPSASPPVANQSHASLPQMHPASQLHTQQIPAQALSTREHNSKRHKRDVRAPHTLAHILNPPDQGDTTR